jgi:hypothetical protein
MASREWNIDEELNSLADLQRDWLNALCEPPQWWERLLFTLGYFP